MAFPTRLPVLLLCFLLFAPPLLAQPLGPLEAENLVLQEVVLSSPNADDLVGFFYQRHTDPLLSPGRAVESWDGSLTFLTEEPTYFFWLDDDPSSEWMHPARFVFVGAETGLLQVFGAESWPVVDGVEYRGFTTLGNASPELFHNQYTTVIADPWTGETRVTTNTDDWVIIAVGRNQQGEVERRGRENDIERIKDYVSGSPQGPGVHEDNITVVSGTDTNGATKSEICSAIAALQGAGCEKVYFFYLGHGDGGYMAVKDEDDDGTNEFTYEELACKLLELGDTEVCVVIEACESGEAIEELEDKEIEGPDGEPRVLKGSVVTSSSSGNTTSREPDGTPFIKGLQACGRDPLADADGDGKVNLHEAISWARAQDPIVEDDDPQGSGLGGAAGKVTFGHDEERAKGDSSSGGGSLYFQEVKVGYRIKDGAVSGRDSTVCIRTLYVENRSGSPHSGTRDICIVCDPGSSDPDTLRIDGKKHWRPELPRQDDDDRLKPHRRCLARIPADCRRWKVYGKNDDKAPVPGAELEMHVGAPVYTPGDLVFEPFLLPLDPGHVYTSEVTPVSGWGLVADPPGFTASPLASETLVAVRGQVPVGATQGALVEWTITDHTAMESISVLSKSLLYGARANVSAGDAFSFQAVDVSGALQTDGAPIDVVDSTLRFTTAGTACSVGPGGQLFLEQSALEAASGTTFTLDVSGELQWDHSTVRNVGSGLVLDHATGSVDGGGVYDSGGPGLVLRGDLSGLAMNRFHIHGSAGEALRAEGASAHLHGLAVEGPGGLDVVVTGGGQLTLVDSSFDAQRIQVDAGSSLSRRWTNPVVVLSGQGDGIAGVGVEIFDAAGDAVAAGVTGPVGSLHVELEEFLQVGALRTARTPHTVLLSAAGRDTTFTHTADGIGFAEFVWPLGSSTAVDPPTPVAATLAVHSIKPNPFNPRTTVTFDLPVQARVVVSIHNARGAIVRTLSDTIRDPGRHDVVWNGRDDRGRDTASGVYLVRIGAAGGFVSEKMTLLR